MRDGSNTPGAQGAVYRSLPTNQVLRAARGAYNEPLSLTADQPVWSYLRQTTEEPFFPDIDPTDEAALKARKARAYKQSGYAQGRRSDIEKLLQDRHGSQCDTDDAEVWLRLAIPFVVQAAEIQGYSGIIAGLRWARKFCPLVPASRTMGIISAALEQRDAEVAEFGITGRHTKWLPSMERLKANLRPTWDEVTRLQLRGFASIDPPSEEDRRHRKTQQRRQQRRAKGIQPQASRNLMEQRRRIAECFGVTVRQVQRWELNGVVPPERVQNLSPPCRELVRGDMNWTSLIPANDDADPDMLPLTETGYRGRNMSMKAWEVQAAIDRHPALGDDLQQHLDAIDAIMAKTPPENHGRVRKHLLQDRNRLALRKVRIEAAAVAPEPQDAFVGQNVSLTSDEVTGLAKRFPALAADIHRHLSELEGSLERVPDENRAGAMRRLVGRRNQLVVSRQRYNRKAA